MIVKFDEFSPVTSPVKIPKEFSVSMKEPMVSSDETNAVYFTPLLNMLNSPAVTPSADNFVSRFAPRVEVEVLTAWSGFAEVS